MNILSMKFLNHFIILVLSPLLWMVASFRSPRHSSTTTNCVPLYYSSVRSTNNHKSNSNKRNTPNRNTPKFPITKPNNKDEGDVSKEVRLDDGERLQKVIARAGIASRREAESMILDGKVSVNGKPVQELGTKVNLRKDRVVVNGKLLSLPDAKSTYWVLLNKPKGVLTTMDDDKDRLTIRSLIPKANDLRLVPVGRMDRDHTGLLLLTNEVGWIHPLTHPSYQISRSYELVIEGIPTQEALMAANKGKEIPGTTQSFPPCSVTVKDVDNPNGLTVLEFQAEQFSSAMLDALISAFKCTLISIKRTSIGSLKLKNMKKGEWRELLPAEISKLKSLCKKSPGKTIPISWQSPPKPTEPLSSSKPYEKRAPGFRR